MATVYLAEHPRINKKVAIKVINPDLSNSREMVSRFFTEARAASQISHDHVVDILDFGQSPDGDNFMIMEYLEGQTIAARLKAAGRLDAPTVLHIAVQIAEALHVAHGQGVIHRDLKPDNIYLVKRGPIQDFVKILDFGLAKLLSNNPAEGQNHRTSSGSVLGTPHYMSPEQCEGKLTIDGRADLYSIGCIMYQMLTGELPFPGDGFAEVLIKHLSEPPPLPRHRAPNIPPSVEKIVLHCLAKEREYRFQSAEELGRALYDPEGFSSWIGDDMMRIVGPLPGGRKLSLTDPPPPMQMPTMMGGNVPAALTAVTGQPPSGPVSAAAASTGPTRSILGGAVNAMVGPGPSAPHGSTPPGAARMPTPPGSMAAQSGLRGQSSSLPLPPPPSGLDVPVVAASSLAEVPGLANRAAPQQATMIGELPPAAMSALLRPPQGAAGAPPDPLLGVTLAPPIPPMATPPLPLAATSQPPALPPPPAPLGEPQQPLNPFEIQTLRPDFNGPPVARPAAPSQPNLLAASSPDLPQRRASQPMIIARPSSAALPMRPSAQQPSLPPLQPQPATGFVGKIDALIARFAGTPVGHALGTLPPERRRLAVLAVGASFLSLLTVTLIIALWPSRVPVELRSLPPLAEVVRDGKIIGKTPLTLKLKKGETVKLLLRRTGYAEAEQDLSADDEPGLVVTLSRSEEPKPADKKPEGDTPGGDTPGTEPKGTPGDKKGGDKKGGDKKGDKKPPPEDKPVEDKPAGGDKKGGDKKPPEDKPAGGDKKGGGDKGGDKKKGGKKKKITIF